MRIPKTLYKSSPNGLAAIYARQSRTDDSKKDKQKRDHNVETTLDTQSNACLREANKRGFSVDDASVFSERYTGAEMWDRPVLSDLRRRIKAREYKALLVYSTDRLARDPIHLALILEECQRAACELVFVSEPLEDSPEGELILYIKGYAAKIERLRIKDRMARGRNAIIAAGKLTCQGNAPYGFLYDLANRVRVIDPQTAPVVRDIFRWTLEGLSARQIRDRLRTMRLPSPAQYAGKKFKRGDPVWNISAVARILGDESYTGVTYVNKTKTTETRVKATGKYAQTWKDKADWKKMPDGVTPAIIERTTFDAARKKVFSHMRKSDYTRNSIRPVLLRGLVFCSKCSCAMYPMSEKTHNSRIETNRTVYRCSASRLKRTGANPVRPACNPKRLVASDLENRIWNKLVSFFLDPAIVAKEVEKVLSSVPDDGLANDLAGAEKQLERARRLRDNHMSKYDDSVADGDDEMSAKWYARVKEANSDVKALSAVIHDLTARLAAYNNSGKTARAFAVQCKKIMGASDFTFDEKRAALEALNVKVFAADGQPTRIQLHTGILAEQRESMAVSVEVTV